MLRAAGRQPFARERAGAEERPGPRAEILRTELLSHHVLDIAIDVPGGDVLHLSGVRAKLEHLAPVANHLAHHARDLPVADFLLLPLLRFTHVVEAHGIAADRHMLAAKRREPVALVLIRVDLAARAQKARAENSEDPGEHLPLGHPRQPEIARHRAAHFRERLNETGEPLFLPALP